MIRTSQYIIISLDINHVPHLITEHLHLDVRRDSPVFTAQFLLFVTIFDLLVAGQVIVGHRVFQLRPTACEGSDNLYTAFAVTALADQRRPHVMRVLQGAGDNL